MRHGGLKTAVVALALVCGTPAGADYEAGRRAWEAGRRDAAIAEWRAGADTGEAKAMLALGRLYLQGLGVPQNYVQAHMWFNLAASRGEATAIAERDALTPKLTPEERAEAQKLALAWQPGGSGTGTRASAAPAPGVKSDGPPVRVIREAQRWLTVLGYQPGPADGVWGGRTLEAWRAFLRDAGQPPADTLTPEALRALRSVGQRQGAGSAQAARPTPPVRRQVRPDGLHRAVQAGSLSGLQAALAAGVDVNARDARGWTALMHAVNKGYTLLVPPLLAAQADLNVRAADGATALFMAVLHGYTETVEALLKAGADHSIPGPRGRTVLEVVKMQEHPELTTLLEQAKQAALARSNAEVEIGRVFLDCPTCPQMVVVPAGIYRMGPTESDSEKPQHEVMIAKPLAVGVYEVTRREFGRFVQETGHAMGNSCRTYEGRKWELRSGRGWQNPGFSQTDLDPMVCVNWHDAQAYASWLSRETGQFYRLLSEAEWEYVARAGSTTKYSWGSEVGRNRANCDGCGSQWDDKKTAPVGSFQPNRFGLYDMHGNVWEWVQDCWNGNYNDAPSDGRAWSTGDCGQRVLRGGSWNYEPRRLRSADRVRYTSDDRNSRFGFRIARSLP